MVGFATDLRARKREEEELRKAHDELEKRVEERTTELKGARERLRYLMTVTPAIVYTNQASDYTCTFVSENVSRIMGFSAWEMLEDKDFWTVRLHPEDASRVFDGNGAAGRERRRDDGIPLPAPRRHYIWIQDTFRVIHDAPRPPARDRRLVGGHLRPQEGGDGARRAHGGDERPRDAGRREPRHHLHHASLRRLRLHLRQREFEFDHGLCAMGDARRQEVLGQASASGGCQPGVHRARAADRPRRRQPRISLPPSRRALHLDPGHFHRHARRRRQAEGDRRLLGRRVGPQAGRGRAASASPSRSSCATASSARPSAAISPTRWSNRARIPERTARWAARSARSP